LRHTYSGRIVGKPEIEKSSQLPWANFLLARDPAVESLDTLWLCQSL
jgi:hypothetical protein